jgi:hypothetical protein
MKQLIAAPALQLCCLPVHDDALAGLVEAGHELLVDDHLGDQSLDRVHVQLKHVRQDWLHIIYSMFTNQL